VDIITKRGYFRKNCNWVYDRAKRKRARYDIAA